MKLSNVFSQLTSVESLHLLLCLQWHCVLRREDKIVYMRARANDVAVRMHMWGVAKLTNMAVVRKIPSISPTRYIYRRRQVLHAYGTLCSTCVVC